MSSGHREILFFGSLAACVISYRVHHDEVIADLAKYCTLKLSATVAAPCPKVEECFGAAATSTPLELRSQHTMECRSDNHQGRYRSLYLPLMLELAHDAASDGIMEETKEEEGGMEGKRGPFSVDLCLTLDAAKDGSTPFPVATKIVPIRCLNTCATQDLCHVVRMDLSRRFLQCAVSEQSACGALQEPVAPEDVACSLYIMVRVLDLSQKASAAVEADDLLSGCLGEPMAVPHFVFEHSLKSVLPYGCMPLAELYRHYALFYSQYYSIVLVPAKEVTLMLHKKDTSHATNVEAPLVHRWNTLTHINFRSVLLGEKAFSPVLLTLAHCCNLRTLMADRNELGDKTCARLRALFGRHRYLALLSLSYNDIHEGGADQLLRLARVNRRLTTLHLDGISCSLPLRSRIQQVVRQNETTLRQDPLNAFSPQYSYLASPCSLPASTMKLALGVWGALVASPVGDVDVWTHNSTTGVIDQYAGENVKRRIEVAKSALSEKGQLSLIPEVARAPLLNEIMRTVFREMARVISDPLVRSLFTDVESASIQYRSAIDDLVDSLEGRSEDSLIPDKLRRAIFTPHPMQQQTPVNEEELYTRSFLRVICTALRGLASGAEWEEVVAVLQGIGRQHKQLHVLEEDYKQALHTFLCSLQLSFGAEEQTPERIAAFLQVLVLTLRATYGPIHEDAEENRM